MFACSKVQAEGIVVDVLHGLGCALTHRRCSKVKQIDSSLEELQP